MEKSHQKYLYYLIISLSLILLANKTYAKSNDLKSDTCFSKQQMYEDYDYMCGIINTSYPYLEVMQMLMKFSVSKALHENRTEIGSFTGIKDFIFLINKSINILHDGHASIVAPGLLRYYLLSNTEYCEKIGIKEETLKLMTAYYSIVNDSVFKKIKLGLRFKYLNGVYYNLRPFVYKGDTVKTSSILESLNGQPVRKYVSSNHQTIPNCRWDVKYKTYFSDFLFLTPEFANAEKVSLRFKLINGKALLMTVKPSETLQILKKEENKVPMPKVKYLTELMSLYVKMDNMQPDNDYSVLIKANMRERTKCIILDVRGNRGGSDKVWEDLLSSIISDTIIYRKQIYARESEFNQKYINFQMGHVDVENLPLFPEKRFLNIFDGFDSICPKQNSLKFEGKIIILADEDTFSAAQSLLAVAKSSRQLVSIGVPTGRFGGFGITPPIFKLPNSKIVISMPCSLDFTNVSELKDLLHDSPEYIIELTFKNYQDFTSTGMTELNIKNDPYFNLTKKIINNAN